MNYTDLNPLYANGKLYGMETPDGKLTNTYSFDNWLRCEVQEILKENIVDWLTVEQFEDLVREVKEEWSNCDSPEEVGIEELVHFIFENSSVFKGSLGNG